jgi:diguanylate cyclase (GGDEF)-like protein
MPNILLIGEEGREAHELSSQIRQFGYVVSQCNDTEEAISQALEEQPAAMLVGVEAGESGVRKIESIEAQKAADPTIPPVIFLASDPEMATRLAAVRAGATALLARPISLLDLVDTLDPLVVGQESEPFRVLIVDDDPQICKFYEAILNEAGMETRVCNNPLEAFDILSQFRAELIIMDLYMPQCRGKDLAGAIRQEPAYDSVPIVFLSAEDDLIKQLDVMTIGGDDFLTKPIRPEHLVLAVYTRARRFRSLRSLMLRDSLTGLLNHTTTREHVESELARMKREEKPLALAMLDLDHFKRINDTYGHVTGDRVLKTFSSMLRQRLRGSDIIGRTGGEEFTVALPGVTQEQAFTIMDDIREAFAKVRQEHDGVEFNVTFSCGVAIFPGYGSITELTEAADKALYKAKNKGRNRIVIAEE